MRLDSLLAELIAKYRSRGVLLDTNLLLLDVVGRHDPGLIRKHKRTATFSLEDFILLEELLDQFPTIVTTPHILAEVSNLSAQIHGSAIPGLRSAFAGRIQLLDERYCTGRQAVADRHFGRLGITDAGVLTLCQEHFLVLTTDATLATVLQSRGRDAINFRNFSPLSWS